MEWAQGNPRRPYYELVAEPRVEMVRVTQNALRKTGRDRQGLKSRLRGHQQETLNDQRHGSGRPQPENAD